MSKGIGYAESQLWSGFPLACLARDRRWRSCAVTRLGVFDSPPADNQQHAAYQAGDQQHEGKDN